MTCGCGPLACSWPKNALRGGPVWRSSRDDTAPRIPTIAWPRKTGCNLIKPLVNSSDAQQPGCALCLCGVTCRGWRHGRIAGGQKSSRRPGWIVNFPDREEQDVLPGASMGATHASRGWPWMDTLGLRGAGTAQRNGFTAFRKIHYPIPPPAAKRVCTAYARAQRASTANRPRISLRDARAIMMVMPEIPMVAATPRAGKSSGRPA